MSYLIFANEPNVTNSIYKIAENDSDLNNLNVDKNIYKIIDITENDFISIKLGDIFPVSFNENNQVTYVNEPKTLEPNYTESKEKEYLLFLKTQTLNTIKQFLNNNPNHTLYNRWNSYYNQLNAVNLNSLTYPFNKTFEKYFSELGQPSYNILQLP